MDVTGTIPPAAGRQALPGRAAAREVERVASAFAALLVAELLKQGLGRTGLFPAAVAGGYYRDLAVGVLAEQIAAAPGFPLKQQLEEALRPRLPQGGG